MTTAIIIIAIITVTYITVRCRACLLCKTRVTITITVMVNIECLSYTARCYWCYCGIIHSSGCRIVGYFI